MPSQNKLFTKFSFNFSADDRVVVVRNGRQSDASLPYRMVANSSVKDHDKTTLSLKGVESNQHQAPNFRSLSCRFPTHFRTFSSKEDCRIITETTYRLERCGFYWGPLGVEEAHSILRSTPLGSYLIRDSRQKDVFFTLSYHAKSGPASVRIEYKQQKFSLAGNKRAFQTLFDLLEYYSTSKKSLVAPCRKWKPTLQELCRRRIMEVCAGKNDIPQLPITLVVQNFLMEFPYKL
ncbi:suppressor of cytokine signaling 1a [Neosynchiropus ocellatus]